MPTDCYGTRLPFQRRLNRESNRLCLEKKKRLFTNEASETCGQTCEQTTTVVNDIKVKKSFSDSRERRLHL